MRHHEDVMGTVVSFELVPGRLTTAAATAALTAACASLHDADATFSLYAPDSPMSRIRRGELAPADCHRDVADVLHACRRARELSGGWFDPWAMPGGLDPTGLVKGWAAQRAAQVLQEAGVSAGMVNAAGDIACFGRPEPDRLWTIGVLDPADPTRIARAFEVRRAIATSGTHERGDHIVDPFAQAPRSRAASATVLGPDLALADALATGLAAEGPAGLARIAALPGFRAYIAPEGGSEVEHPVARRS